MGWTLGLCWMLNAFLGVIWLMVFVGRSKLVLDFALTVHGVHLLLVSAWTGGLPGNLLWWGLQMGSVALMVGGGVWSCRWRELRPISFGGGSSKGTTDEMANGQGEEARRESAEGRDIEEGVGYGRGRGRGKGRDGGGQYEMIRMGEVPNGSE